MSEIVTLNLDESGGGPSPALLADIAFDEIVTNAKSVVGGLKRHDFRLHADGTFDGVDFDGHGARLVPHQPEYHWLLGSVYGREVLKTYVGLFQPAKKISKWRIQPELNDDLESVVDQLGLRELQKPKTVGATIRYISLMSKLILQAEGARAVAI